MQISAIESGAMQKLIRMLSLESTAVQNRVLTALAALVRNFPYAQLKFYRPRGLECPDQSSEDRRNGRKAGHKSRYFSKRFTYGAGGRLFVHVNSNLLK